MQEKLQKIFNILLPITTVIVVVIYGLEIMGYFPNGTGANII
ncbi:MAG: hypothetical protein Q8P72_03695 [Candidatus Roizmanbacteria bacterium]|nr:hypothetical protein [Candidatus Roizmanbacteria bacterium]